MPNSLDVQPLIVKNWAIFDKANSEMRTGGPEESGYPSKCSFVVRNQETSPHSLIELTEDVELVLAPPPSQTVLWDSPENDIPYENLNPVQRHLLFWFFEFWDKSSSLGNYTNGAPIVLDALCRKATEMHRLGLIHLEMKDCYENRKLVKRLSINHIDAWRVVANCPCKPISDATRKFLWLVLCAIEKWDQVNIASGQGIESTPSVKVSHAAILLEVSDPTVSRWCSAGKLETNGLKGKQRRISMDGINRVLQARNMKPKGDESEQEVENKLRLGRSGRSPDGKTTKKK
ncbi:MAG: hypothetical protein SGI88_16510 [Candidatus Hydrogenedentes bacterium]|nr:hypothetical protein [Candidatus Hydrogenedentota bacterium]